MIINNTHDLNQASTDELPISANFSPTEIVIARHIAHYANKAYGYCVKTYKTMAKEKDVCLKTIYRTVKKLKELGMARIVRNGRNPSQLYITKKIKELFSVKTTNVQTKSKRTPNTINKKKKKDRSDLDRAWGVCTQNKLTEDEALTVIKEVEPAIAKGHVKNIAALTQSVVGKVKRGELKLVRGPQTRERELAEDMERCRREDAKRAAEFEEMQRNVKRGDGSMTAKSLFKKFREALSG